MKPNQLATTLLLILLGPWAAGQELRPGDGSSLFADNAPLAIDFVMDQSLLCRAPNRSNCPDAPATIVYKDKLGVEHRVAVRVRIRGRWKPENGNCRFPALFVFIDTTQNDPLFAEHDVLPLTTHCQPRKEYEQYLLKEFLGYRILNQLTAKSLRVRLVRVAYSSPGASKQPVVRYGFFIEHFSAMARRHGAKIWRPEKFNPLDADPFEAAIVSLFQFMIGNTDWSIVYGHNIVVIRDQHGLPTPVPFDLDFAGLVNARYAGPPPNLPIRSVRQRLYRGMCRSNVDWAEVFGYFGYKRESIMTLVTEIPGMSDQHRRRATSYVAEFYKLLDNPKLRKKRIINACRGKK